MADPILGFDELRNPVVFIRIDGKSSPELEKRRVTFSFSDKFGKKDQCKMTFRDHDRALANGSFLQPGDVWEIRWGYFGDLSRTRTLTLKSWQPNYDANSPQVSVDFRVSRGRISSSAVAKSSRYGTEPEHTFAPRNWGVITSTEVAKKIARRHKLKFKGSDSGDASKNAPFIQPGNMSDFEYLQAIAFDVDFEYFIEDNTLFYREKPYKEAPRRVLWYHGPDTYLLSFVPQVKITSVTVKPRWAASARMRLDKAKWLEYGKAVRKLPRNATERQLVDLGKKFGLNDDQMNELHREIKARPSMSGAIPTGDSQPGAEGFSGFIKSLEGLSTDLDEAASTASTIAAGPGAEQGHFAIKGFKGVASNIKVEIHSAYVNFKAADEKLRNTIAAATYKKRTDKSVTATAKVIGSPRFRARTNLRFEGMGRFSAKWYVKDSTHTISANNSYTVSLALKRGALADTQGPKTNTPKAKDKEPPREAQAGFKVELGSSGEVTVVSDVHTAVPQS